METSNSYVDIAAAGGQMAASLYGSAVSKNESRQNRREARRQFNAQMDESVQRRVADALKAGINPLTALGYHGGASPTIHAGGSSGAGEILASGLSSATDHLSKALKGALEEKAEDDIEYDKKVKELDLESRRLENRILRQRADSMINSASGGAAGHEEPAPSRTGDMPLFSIAYDLQDRPRLIVNQNAMEMDSDNAGYISSLKHAISQGFIDKTTGEVNSDQYRMMLDDMYYNMTGRHIQNLNQLYFSPAEVAAALAIAARGI